MLKFLPLLLSPEEAVEVNFQPLKNIYRSKRYSTSKFSVTEVFNEMKREKKYW